MLLWKRWCLLGLPVMPKTPRVAPPTLALRATTAEADRATTAAEAIPFMPAKLHKTNGHIHHCLLPIIPCHYTQTYHTPFTIYINLSCFHFLFSERKQNLLTKFYSQKRPNAISGHDWPIGLQWMKIQNHMSGFCARERNEEIPYDMVLWICSTE